MLFSRHDARESKDWRRSRSTADHGLGDATRLSGDERADRPPSPGNDPVPQLQVVEDRRHVKVGYGFAVIDRRLVAGVVGASLLRLVGVLVGILLRGVFVDIVLDGGVVGGLRAVVVTRQRASPLSLAFLTESQVVKEAASGRRVLCRSHGDGVWWKGSYAILIC